VAASYRVKVLILAPTDKN